MSTPTKRRSVQHTARAIVFLAVLTLLILDIAFNSQLHAAHLGGSSYVAHAILTPDETRALVDQPGIAWEGLSEVGYSPRPIVATDITGPSYTVALSEEYAANGRHIRLGRWFSPGEITTGVPATTPRPLIRHANIFGGVFDVPTGANRAVVSAHFASLYFLMALGAILVPPVKWMLNRARRA